MRNQPYINDSFQVKKSKPINQINNVLGSSISKQKHVTFRSINQTVEQFADSTKPKYHFTYGKSYNQPNIKPQSIDTMNNKITQNPDKQFQISNNSKITQKVNQNRSSALGRSHSSQRKRKRLRIFPQKFQKNINNDNILQKKIEFANRQNQIEQIAELKFQIKRLRDQIKGLSLNISKNTSRDFTESVYRNEIQRTKRLSELNDFNQKLYGQLAQKLKEISVEEYENYLSQSHQNKVFVQSVFSSASKQRPYQTFDYANVAPYQKFIDNQQFQKQYQQKYIHKDKISEKNLHIDVKGEINSQKQQIQSPFLLKENHFNKKQFIQTTQTQPLYKQKNQAFTFHKQQKYNKHNNSKPLQQRANKFIILEVQNENIKQIKKTNYQNFYNKQQNKKKPFDIEKYGKQQKQIQDFNRQLQIKIMKKRTTSQYAYFNKNRKY